MKSDYDKIIDDLFHSNKVSASENFTDKLFAKLEKEKLLDGIADEMLSASPVKASASFTDKVLSEIRRQKWQTLIYKFVPASAVAAACVLTFAIFLTSGNSQGELDLLARDMANVESELSSMQDYEEMFDEIDSNFWDYDLNLYAVNR